MMQLDSVDDLTEVISDLTQRFGTHDHNCGASHEHANHLSLSSVAGVYHHYPRKQALIVGLLDLTMAELNWRVTAARDGAATPVEAFAAVVEAMALFHAVRADLAFLGASEMRALAEPDRSRVTALRNHLQYLLDDQAEACRAAGHFTIADPRTGCRAIATMCTSLPSWFRLDGPMSAGDVARRYADYAVRIMR